MSVADIESDGFYNAHRELWRIFTFYNLHAGCLDPGLMKGGRFVKFCKDVQIIRKVPLQQLNLLFVAQVKAIPSGGISTTKQKAMKAKSLTVLDFLELLHTIAPKVYPKATSPTHAFRRLLLENVLPLAIRRPGSSVSEFLDDADISALLSAKKAEELSPEDEKVPVVKTIRISSGLKGIFDFYAAKCMLRRNSEISAQVGRRRDERGSTAQIATATRKEAKELSGSQGKIGYPEAMDFAHGYCFFSSDSGSALLTTYDVANIYLNTVTMDEKDMEVVPHLGFSEFVQMIARIAMVAYSSPRHKSLNSKEPAKPIEKMKALFLYMWKSVNHPRKAQAVMGENFRSGGELNAVGGKGGNVNICGSSLFNQAFYTIWAADKFCTYISMGDYVPDEALVDESGISDKKAEVLELKAGGANRRKSAWEVDDLNITKKEAETNENEGEEESTITLKVSDLKKLFMKDRTLVDVVHGWIEDMLDAKARENLSRR